MSRGSHRQLPVVESRRGSWPAELFAATEISWQWFSRSSSVLAVSTPALRQVGLVECRFLCSGEGQVELAARAQWHVQDPRRSWPRLAAGRDCTSSVQVGDFSVGDFIKNKVWGQQCLFLFSK